LKLTEEEKQLKSETSVIYKNPPTLGSKLLNFKHLAHNTELEENKMDFFRSSGYGRFNFSTDTKLQKFWYLRGAVPHL